MDTECVAVVDNDFKHTLPTEVLNKIFLYLWLIDVKDLMICRQVCHRWKLIIDEIASKEDYWQKFCERDFNNCYLIARHKANTELTWYNLYRSLSLWPKLALATEECTEFATASNTSEEILNVTLRGNGILSIHRRCFIEYYESDTLKVTTLGPVEGQFCDYGENYKENVGRSYHQLNLYFYSSNRYRDAFVGFPGVKMFWLTDYNLYNVTLQATIDLYRIYQDVLMLGYMFSNNPQYIISLGYSMDCLHVLTFTRKIYSITASNDIIFRASLTTEWNILNVLHKYNLLEQMDWLVYHKWMNCLFRIIPLGPLSMIVVVKPYGDVFFVGSSYGEILIFYKPYRNGELDIYNTVPVRTIYIRYLSIIKHISDYTMLQIDAVETEKGHTLYIAMPQRVLVIKYTHDFLSPQSWTDVKYDHSYSC